MPVLLDRQPAPGSHWPRGQKVSVFSPCTSDMCPSCRRCSPEPLGLPCSSDTSTQSQRVLSPQQIATGRCRFACCPTGDRGDTTACETRVSFPKGRTVNRNLTHACPLPLTSVRAPYYTGNKGQANFFGVVQKLSSLGNTVYRTKPHDCVGGIPPTQSEGFSLRRDSLDCYPRLNHTKNSITMPCTWPGIPLHSIPAGDGKRYQTGIMKESRCFMRERPCFVLISVSFFAGCADVFGKMNGLKESAI